MDEKCNPRRSLDEHQDRLIQLEDGMYRPIDWWYCPECERITVPNAAPSKQDSKKEQVPPS